MDYVRLGRTGLKVSRICLGTMTYGSSKWHDWVLDEKEARPFYKTAIEMGITFFDTADVYSLGVSEEVTGRALREFAKRDEIVVATKVFNRMGQDPNNHGLSRRHIMDAIDASLKRLGMEFVDLYQIHRWDPETPIEETLEALTEVVRSGKARYIGASSMYAWQFARALGISEMKGWSRFVSMQNHYNLVYREEEREMIPLCVDQGIGIIPWSPLARGFLAGTGPATRVGDDAKQVRRFCPRDVLPGRGLRDRGPRGHGGERYWKNDAAGGPGVDALQAVYHVTHCRGEQASPPRAGRGVTFDQARSGPGQAPGGTLPAASRARA